MIPQDIKFAAPFDANQFYPSNAVSVGSDNVIYWCSDMNFCDVDPATRVGKMGWEASDFKTTDIKNICYVDSAGKKEEDPNSGFDPALCTAGGYDATKATANYHPYWIEMKAVLKATGCGTSAADCSDDPTDAAGAIGNMVAAEGGKVKGTAGMPTKKGDVIVMKNIPTSDSKKTGQMTYVVPNDYGTDRDDFMGAQVISGSTDIKKMRTDKNVEAKAASDIPANELAIDYMEWKKFEIPPADAF